MITIPLTLRQLWFPLRGKKKTKKPLLINYDMSYSTNAVIMLKKKCISESLACSNNNDNMNDQHLLRSHEVSGIVDLPWREFSLLLFLSHNGAMDAGGAVKPSSLPPQLLITSCWDTFCICQNRVDLLCVQPLSDQHWWSPVGAGGRVGGELPSRTFPLEGGERVTVKQEDEPWREISMGSLSRAHTALPWLTFLSVLLCVGLQSLQPVVHRE